MKECGWNFALRYSTRLTTQIFTHRINLSVAQVSVPLQERSNHETSNSRSSYIGDCLATEASRPGSKSSQVLDDSFQERSARPVAANVASAKAVIIRGYGRLGSFAPGIADRITRQRLRMVGATVEKARADLGIEATGGLVVSFGLPVASRSSLTSSRQD